MIESALRYNRTPAVVLLIVLTLISWMWIVVMARDMYGPMTGASAWMMTAVWDVRHLALLWAMWAVMMLGMMLPSASPMLLLFGGVARRSATGASAASGQIYAFAAGYLVAWALFSLAATALQRLLATLLFASPMMEATHPVVGAALLLIAGVYQLTPIKQACLRTCQSPFGFLMSRWRTGVSGAFRMGLEHGVHCVGCLLGADAAAVCRRCHESCGHCGADSVGGVRKVDAARRARRTNQWCLADCRGPLDVRPLNDP